MNLTTRCPSCGTAFRVQPAQLSARGGKVRCGKCGHVFDGVKSLVAENAAPGEAVPEADTEPSPQLGLFEAPKKLTEAGDAANEDAPVPEFLDDAVPPRRRAVWAIGALLALATLLLLVIAPALQEAVMWLTTGWARRGAGGLLRAIAVIALLIGILPLQSFRHAEFLHNEVPGIQIPDWIRRRMHDAGNEGQRVGVELARQLLSECRDLANGVYLMPSFGRYENCLEVLEGVLDGARGRS